MKRLQIQLGASCAGTLSLVGAMLALGGCSGDPVTSTTESQAQAAANVDDGTSIPISQLPLLDSASRTQHLAEPLAKATGLGETTALHVRLPPPQNQALANSLARVVGDPDHLQLMVRSDFLAQTGVIPKSPGKDFFTAFASVAPDELDRLKSNQDQIASGMFGETTRESVVFDGRSAVGRTVFSTFDPTVFQPSQPMPLNICRPRPVSTLQAWGQSLFITSTAVIQDPLRTWDPCTGFGTKGGVWTFSHLIREMAAGAVPAMSASDFVKDWLSNWLNNYVVNGDIVLARTAMFTQVIKPWATASGVGATLVTDTSTGRKSVNLTGPLDLDIAPFRLLAIVNRVDLGGGGGGYNNSGDPPKNPGELRFIFGVVQPSPWGAGTEATCGKKPFTTIFEYGVPGVGCAPAVAWANKWTALAAFPGFTSAYLAQLQTMTESVVRFGMAPTKGNKNAINQIRTNEIALGSPWELREFRLTIENPPANTDTPASGPLRTHTVINTPDDGTYSAAGSNVTVNGFINGYVSSKVTPPAFPPGLCSLNSTPLPYDVPYFIGSLPFRGGNSLMGPGHWNLGGLTAASSGVSICARHQFSLNTCNGCHLEESGTTGGVGNTIFTHIDPLAPIASPRLSKFLTGGGLGLFYTVADPQLGPSVPWGWQYADLERRFQHLFDLSHCTACATIHPMTPAFLNQIQALGPVPADVTPGTRVPFQVGPITDPAVVGKLLDLRSSFAGNPLDEPVDFIRPMDTFSH